MKTLSSGVIASLVVHASAIAGHLYQNEGISAPYKRVGTGVAFAQGTLDKWLGHVQYQGVVRCYQAVMEDDECAKDFFTYVTNGDEMCGCKRPGNLVVRSDGNSDVFFIGPYQQVGSGVAFAEGTSEKWLEAGHGFGPLNCYYAVMEDDECMKDYFTYVTNGDGRCGCKTPGKLAVRSDAQSDYYRIGLYEQIGTGVIFAEGTGERWLGHAQGQGLEACYEAVMADDECAKDYFTYVTNGDEMCGCNRPGKLAVRNDAVSEYYRIEPSTAAVPAAMSPSTGLYERLSTGVAFAEGTDEKWLGHAQGHGVRACYEAVVADDECAQDYFTYVTNGDGACGCKRFGKLGVRSDGISDYFRIGLYQRLGKGVVFAEGTSEKWLGRAQGKGVPACYEAVMADDECAQDYFTYVTDGDEMCGCKKPGQIGVRREANSDYFRIGLYDREGAGVAVAEGTDQKLLGHAQGQGLLACYRAVMADDECAQDFFTYATNGDQTCGCKRPGELDVRNDGVSDHYRISYVAFEDAEDAKEAADALAVEGAGLYERISSGVAFAEGTSEKWLEHAQGKGVMACYEAAMADDECAQDYFTYVTNGDEMCGCKGPGTLGIRSDSNSDMFRMGLYQRQGKGVAVAEGASEKWLAHANGQGLMACYEAVLANDECAQDYFTYATNGDGACGCKRPGTLSLRSDANSDYYRIGLYEPVGTGVIYALGTSEKWLGDAQGKGLLACYEATVADDECAKDYFTYVTNGDKSCGCKRPGEVGVRREDISDYYRIEPGTAAVTPAPISPSTGLYERVSTGVSFAEGTSEKWLTHVSGHGVQACYRAVMADDECAKDFFTYVTKGDEACGCKRPGKLAVRSDGISDYFRIGLFERQGTGVAFAEGTHEKWLGHAQGQGVAACYEAVMADDECAKDYFTYVTNGDEMCGCKRYGPVLGVRSDGISDYFRVVHYLQDLSCEVREGWDIEPGSSDYTPPEVEADSDAACQELCIQDTQCGYFVFHGDSCLKYGFDANPIPRGGFGGSEFILGKCGHALFPLDPAE